MSRLVAGLSFAFALACAGCAAHEGEDEASEDAVVVDNRSPLAKAQYNANIAFAKSYQAKCRPTPGRKRVLVTGFGRFMHIRDNATGRIVSRVADLEYPMTDPPAEGQIDPPEPQSRTGMSTVRLPQSGEVDVCGMVLPVFWDLAAILIAKEIEAIQPDVVIMNGVAGDRQELYIELGSVNRAMRSADGSDILVPYAPEGREPVIVQGAAPLRGLRLSWDAVKSAAERSIQARAGQLDGDERLDRILLGAKLAGFPRGGNTYLCNNVTYVTNYLMERPGGRPVTLLKALDRDGPEDDYVKIGISHDLRKTPRVFLHWPSQLVGRDNLLDAAAGVLEDVLDAQLQALARGEVPTVGDNERADPSLRGGSFF